MTRLRIAVVLCAALGCAQLSAKPADWFLWRSASNDGFVCAQISPGDDWVKIKGPFTDAQCKKPRTTRGI